MSEHDFDVVVIGGGQAGLAMGYYLRDQGLRFAIVERGDSIAPAWRERWDSLTLFTPRRYSALPGLPFPGDPDGYPTREEVIAYLERYAETFELPIELNSDVRRLSKSDGRFVLELHGRTITSNQVVVATGPFQTPYVPKIAESLEPGVWQAHSTGYRRPSDVPEGTVLVVGGGNTGFQIAKELSATHKVVLSVGSKQKPLPQRIAGRDLFWWLTKTRLLSTTVESRLGSKLRYRDTLIGSSPRELTRKFGVEPKSRATDVAGRTVRFEDGSTLEVDAVVWATGYRPDYSWIELPILDSDGRLRHRRGVTDVPGLSFLGLTWQWTRGSALIGWVKDDAAFLVERIAASDGGKTRSVPERETDVSAPPPGSARRISQPMHDHHSHGHGHTRTGDFPTSTEGLAEAQRPEMVDLSDGDEFELRIAPVTKEIGGNSVRMLAYNGSIPGPTLKVRQGSQILVHAVNEGDLEATVHWHGLRLDNEYDGTHQTQKPMAEGESFTYRLRFPDEGLYWYHPHIRQDYGQEMGLYGNILVEPNEPDYWPPAHREVLLTLDDILLDEDGRVAPFSPHETNYVAMGRFGTTFLVAGEPELSMSVKQGEVVRFYLTDTANTRVFKVGVAGARMKLVGGDSGRHEREEMVEDVILAPSERVVVDVLFDEPGEATLEHRTPERTYPLVAITIEEERAEPELEREHAALRVNDDLSAERNRIASYLEAAPDKTLAFVAEMDEIGGEGVETGIYACPMHEDIVATWAGKCPKCGMKLMPAPAETEPPTAVVCPMHPEITATWAGTCPKCGMTLRATGTRAAADLGDAPDSGETADGERHVHGHEEHGDGHGHGQHEDHHGHQEHHAHREQGGHAHGAAEGIEWEDDMVELNRKTTPANMRWLIVDRETGAENAAIDWQFHVGDQVKIRLVNEMESDHPMHHPFHIHGAGRFLVLSRDGLVEPNLVWKDTVLVRTGETVDILLDVSEPGLWMAHCHIAEHHESGMMFSFTVAPEAARSVESR